MARSPDGVEIAYGTHGRTGGDAPVVVLVHGWAGNRTWILRAKPVPGRRRRGAGRSHRRRHGRRPSGRHARLAGLRPQPPPADPCRLAELTAPVVAINPDVAPTDVESLRRHGVEPIVLTGVGHFVMLEDPEQFNPVLVTTLTSFFR